MHVYLLDLSWCLSSHLINLTFFSSTPLYPSESDSDVLQVSVNYHGNSSCNEHTYGLNRSISNYSGNSLCDECMYQPYMECQKTTLVTLCVMNICTSLI